MAYSHDMDNSILRQCDTIIFKEPGLHQPDSERPEIKSRAKQAARVFKEIPREKRHEAWSIIIVYYPKL